jgi:hypothetical protein
LKVYAERLKANKPLLQTLELPFIFARLTSLLLTLSAALFSTIGKINKSNHGIIQDGRPSSLILYSGCFRAFDEASIRRDFYDFGDHVNRQ